MIRYNLPLTSPLQSFTSMALFCTLSDVAIWKHPQFIMKKHLHTLMVALFAITLHTELALAADAKQDFANWLEGIRSDALAAGGNGEILDPILANFKLLPRVIELDRNQPEGRLTFEEYLSKVVPQRRVIAARQRLKKHAWVLGDVEADYLVQRRFIIALWGIESDFGRFTGGYSIVNALGTLAFDGRRSTFFRSELIDALKILGMGEVSNSQMTGSWAGAMGQCQFMPSSFHRFAVDYDKNGKRDIWDSLPDVFASIANYLYRSGWKFDQTWGREVTLPQNFDLTLIGLEHANTIQGWQDIGVRRADGTDLPGRQLSAAIILPDGAGSTAYMVYDNFRNIMKWNRSTYFALAIGILSDQLLQ